MPRYPAKIISGFLLSGIVSLSSAAPIRVGIFKGVGKATGSGSSYWHTSIHPGSAAIAAMLANPAQAQLQNPPVPAQGFAVTMYGVETSCADYGCAASDAQLTTFFATLDSLDVVVFPNNVSMGNAITDSVQRQRLASFWTSKGVVSLHWSNYSSVNWPAWDSVHGTRFHNRHDYVEGTVRLDTAGLSPQRPASWRMLNRGLPDTARFREEWLAFTTTGAAIRLQTSLIPTVNLDDNSFTPRLSDMPKGDHPFSWYREFPEGGRFFYTGMGHQTSTYESEYFFRRQVYNAVLWAAGADSNGVVSLRPAGATPAAAALQTGAEIRASRSRIQVRIDGETPYRVDLHALDGKLVASRKGNSDRFVSFDGLKPRTVYLVSIVAPHFRESRRVFLD